MIEFETSLLRERFTIREPDSDEKKSKPAFVALSNRMVIPLVGENGIVAETFVVRTQSMHTCVRMAARIIQAFDRGGVLLSRQQPFDWDECWEGVIKDYDQTYHPELWAAIYAEGKLVYQWGKHHPLLDMIEKCEHTNEDHYDNSVRIAEETFKKTGKDIKLNYNCNVAMVVNFEEDQGKCAFILRRAHRTSTFNFTAMRGDGPPVNIAQCLSAGAALLEGIQLSFLIGMNNEKILREIIPKDSAEEKQTKAARKRLGALSAEVNALENVYEVRYRPERPEFQEIVEDSEKKARRLLGPRPLQQDTE